MKKLYTEYKSFIWGGLLFVGSLFILNIYTKSLTLDLTDGRLHTLSEGSRNVLRKLPGPVDLKLFYSKTAAAKGSDQIRVFTTHFEYVKEVLELFVRHSNNKVRLTVVDPRPDTPEEEEAVIAGLKKFQLTDTETYIFGLVAQEESGSTKVIEFFDPGQEELLEYQLAKLLTSLHQSNKKRVGILSAEELMGWQRQWFAGTMLEELYTVTNLGKDTTEIKDVDLVFVHGASGLDEKAWKALDQWLVNGGKVIMAVDPHDDFKGLQNFWKAWGIEVPARKFAGDMSLAGMGRTNPYMPVQRLLPVMSFTKPQLSSVKEVSVSQLNQLTFLFPGYVERKSDVKELTLVPLLQTTDKGGSYEDFGMGLSHPQGLIESFRPGTKPLTLAARLEGKFPTAFTETKVPKEQKESKLVLIADTDFLKNEYAFSQNFLGATPINDNVAFFLNLVDQFTGSEDLMSIRSRGSFRRPFTTIQKIRLEADQNTIGKVQEINASISRFQSELAGLAGKANQGNLGVIQSEGLKKQKELQMEIARLKSELREAKREGREKVESIGTILYFLNVGLVPLLIGTIYLVAGRKKTKAMKGEKTNESADALEAL